MTVLHYKAEFWSKVLLEAYRKQLVFGSDMVINRDYEDEVSRFGDTVHITSLADPTIATYTPGSTLNYQQLQDAGQSFVIDQAKSWSAQMNDVDRRQQVGDLQGYFEGRAAYRIADVQDQFIASLYTGVDPANVLGSSAAPLTPALYTPTTPADFYLSVLLPLGVLLDQLNVPDQGRYCILPPFGAAMAAQTQAFVQFPGNNGTAGEVMATRAVGELGGFTIMKSNNVVQTVAGGPGTGVYAIQAGHNSAITFADQIAENEALRSQADFADLIRGLNVYGGKLTRPEAIAIAYVKRPAGI
ncbi:MAG: hypothetical protein ACRDRN_10350 [Sciscionella sp.]